MSRARCLSAVRRTLCMVVLLGVAAGCTRSFFRKSADHEVEGLLEEKSIDPRSAVQSWHVYPDGRARFADFDNPDRPRKPPDDPMAAALSPDSQPIRGHFHSGPDQEGQGYLEFLRYCDQHNRSARAKDEKPLATLGLPIQAVSYVEPAVHKGSDSFETALQSNEPGFLITLDQALELSLFNSRDFQDRREDLYLSALPVTLERFNLGTQLFASAEAIRTWSSRDVPGGPGSRWDVNGDLSATRLLPTGATIMASLANRLVIDLGSGSPHVGLSTMTVDIVQPLLKGGGWAVTLEPLTQSERNLLYGVRSFSRFRGNFYVYVAAGGDLFNSSYSYAGLNLRGVGPSLTTGGQGLGYLPTLLATALEHNERENLHALTGYLALYKEYQGRGDFSELQVGQVEQQILGSQSSLLTRQQNLKNGLDKFKLQLGLPTQLPLELDESPTRAMHEMLNEFAQARDQFQDLRNEADRYYSTLRTPLEALAGSAIAPLPINVPLRGKIEALVYDSPVTRATKTFRSTIRDRWERWRRMSQEELRAEIQREAEELRQLQVEEARYQARNQKFPDEQTARLAALPNDLVIGQMEQSLRLYDAAQAKKQGTLREAAVRYEAVVNDFIRVMSEARQERRDSLRESWPKLPAISVEGADLLTEDLDRAQTIAAQVALANRVELMNSRALMVDAWRKIAVEANSLLGVLNVGYNFNGLSPPNSNQPISVGGSRSQHQLVINGELPLVRRSERNEYRTALIAYQRARRNVQATEDFILNDVRSDLRNLRVLAENYRIQQRAVQVAFDQVENSLDVLQAPPQPAGGPAQPGQAAAQANAGNAAALTQQLLSAQTSLVNAQNGLYTVWVNYLIARMTFYRDIERLPLDQRGVWIDEYSSPPVEPESLPDPVRVDTETGEFAELRVAGDR